MYDLQQTTRRAQVVAARGSDVCRTRIDTAQQSYTRFAKGYAKTRADAADGLCAVPTQQRSRQLLLAATEHPRSFWHASVAKRTQSKCLFGQAGLTFMVSQKKTIGLIFQFCESDKI